jgi:hypothetical protein
MFIKAYLLFWVGEGGRGGSHYTSSDNVEEMERV